MASGGIHLGDHLRKYPVDNEYANDYADAKNN